ncbi:putative oocyte-secreted protein 1 homolog [Tupaia chinensis]|uniref:putative oocyte-secreted protein 1 homolog n=1 Tax=Tupaia chinensis TaxID=246437 RepID=UPI0003C91745|nr:putative oocyte-secreted protein 1 homolog [Tupaia chinensis]
MDGASGSGQMKVFLVLGGLPLLFSLIWICSGEEPSVYVRCNPSLFLVRIKPTAFDEDLFVSPNDVFLGNQCPVTSVHQGLYEFLYHPSDCGIRTEVLPGNWLLFESRITFMSVFAEFEASILVFCAVPGHVAPIKINGYNADKQSGPPRSSGIANLPNGNAINWELKNNDHYFKNFMALFLHLRIWKLDTSP